MVRDRFPAKAQSQPQTPLSLPYYLSPVRAGFPSPADDYIEQSLDLNQYLIKHPSSTFFVRVKGDSMAAAGIFSGDILVVDRSVRAYRDRIVVAVLDGEFTVKRFRETRRGTFLESGNPGYPPFEIKDGTDFEVWGVVTNVIRFV